MSDKLPRAGADHFKAEVVIPSGDYKSVDPSVVTVDTRGCNTLRVDTDVTALSGSGCTVTVLVEGETESGSFYTLLSKAITATGVTSQLIGKDIAASAGVALNAPLPRRVRITCTGSGTRTTLTYAVCATTTV